VFEEGKSRLAQQTGVIRRGLVQRVERDDCGGIEQVNGLHEAGCVARHAGEKAAERIALVVIAHQQDGRRIQSREH
jgi:hypothetical protein